ncbi:MAG: hypothetical protein FWH40_02030 [Coriobacteriia bacterium]|nr:hypothetical protein [Coriobacteriia bacterium]
MTDTKDLEVQFIDDMATATEYQLKHTANVVVSETADGKLLSISVGLNGFTHPQTEEHLVEWLAVENDGVIIEKVFFTADQTPEFDFLVKEAGTLVVQAFCNLHGIFGIYV